MVLTIKTQKRDIQTLKTADGLRIVSISDAGYLAPAAITWCTPQEPGWPSHTHQFNKNQLR